VAIVSRTEETGKSSKCEALQLEGRPTSR